MTTANTSASPASDSVTGRRSTIAAVDAAVQQNRLSEIAPQDAPVPVEHLHARAACRGRVRWRRRATCSGVALASRKAAVGSPGTSQMIAKRHQRDQNQNHERPGKPLC